MLSIFCILVKKDYLSMTEIWKDIEGYEGLYQVSNMGRVKSLGKGGTHKQVHYLKQAKERCGYLFVALCKKGKVKQFKVHRLVAKAFIPNPNNLSQVNHKDEDKTNNRVDNLEWCDCIYNINYGTAIKRRAKAITRKIICLSTGKTFTSAEAAADYYNIHISGIRMCCQGRRNIAGGFKWQYTT